MAEYDEGGGEAMAGETFPLGECGETMPPAEVEESRGRSSGEGGAAEDIVSGKKFSRDQQVMRTDVRACSLEGRLASASNQRYARRLSAFRAANPRLGEER